MTEQPTLPFEDPKQERVLAWIEAHPEFVAAHADVLRALLPIPLAEDDKVVDLQGFLVGRLQRQLKEVREECGILVSASRDNHSVQMQVHQSVLAIIATHGLEQLVDVLTTDLVQRFGVDVVRLGLESPIAEAYDVQYHEQNYSGICFLPMGLTDGLIGSQKRVRLIGDIRKTPAEGFRDVFAECSGIVRSCALLRLQLPKTKRYGMLAFGVKEVNHFHSRQGTELLIFLARALETKLDEGLRSSGIEELLE